jgi:hypothetical protein
MLGWGVEVGSAARGSFSTLSWLRVAGVSVDGSAAMRLVLNGLYIDFFPGYIFQALRCVRFDLASGRHQLILFIRGSVSSHG